MNSYRAKLTGLSPLLIAVGLAVASTTALANRSPVNIPGIGPQGHGIQADIRELTLLPEPEARLQTPTFSTCSSAQITLIDGSINRVEKEVSNSLEALLASSPAELSASPRYGAWFGEFDEDRHNRVVTTLSNMQQVLDQDVLDFDCTCLMISRDFLFGFIRQSRPFDINLCPLFFSTEDDEITTLVHELSHFVQIAATEDIVFGPEASQQLAASDPGRAVRNAENYGFFISNTSPPLTLTNDNNPLTDGQNVAPQASGFEPLLAGGSVTGDLIEGETRFYVVSDTSALTLESVTGDADLQIFSDATLDDLLCTSQLQTTADACAVQQGTTHYVVVSAFTDASFNLGAAQSRTVPILFEPLASDQTIRDSLALGEADYFTVPSSGSLLLDSVTGDVDLSVFNSAGVDVQSLVCESDNRSVVSESDLCLVEPGAELFVRVFANEASTYSLESRQIASDNGLPLNIETLVDGDRVDTFVGDGEQQFFNVSGPGRVDLISQSGDADLIIRDVEDFDAFVCQSNEFSLDSAVDSCLIDAGSRVAVVVGFTPAEFSLIFTEGENLPERPDNIAVAGSGGGGGGAASWLLLLLTFITFTWRHCRHSYRMDASCI